MELSDEALVQHAVLHKDANAFAELVQRHQAKVLLLQRRLIGEASLAEDLTQETFLRAWQKLHTFNATGSFGGWLASLGYNVFLGHLRQQKKHRGQLSLDALAQDQTPAQMPPDPALADLDRLLGILARDEQIMLILGYAYGLSNTEVGELLGLPTGTVKARIHRAKAKIRARVAAPGKTHAGTEESKELSPAAGDALRPDATGVLPA